MRAQAIKILFLSLAAVWVLAARCADTLESVAKGASNDLQQALADLASARQGIDAERLPLARKVADAEQRLVDRRLEFSKAQRFQENQLVELNALKAEARQRSDEVKYIDSLLGEYGRSFRTRLNFVEEPKYQPTFESFEKAGVAVELSPAERFPLRAALLTTALERAERALGGEFVEGRALDRLGRVQPGKVALVGPVAVFAAHSGGSAGVLQQELNKSDPTVVTVDPRQIQASRELVTSGHGSLIVDPTLGNAFRMSTLEEGLADRLAKGGLIMIPLLGLGLASVGLALMKWLQLARIRVARESDLQTVLRHIQASEPGLATQHARRISGLSGNLLATAVEHVGEKKEYIEEVLYEKMLAARATVDRGLAFLALAATTGPLLGLLGTVMGMISTFKMISSVGSGDPKQLAAGISEALICTATGMAVAIPSLLFHAFLSRKAKGIIGSMEQTAVGFINGVPDPESDSLLASNT